MDALVPRGCRKSVGEKHQITLPFVILKELNLKSEGFFQVYGVGGGSRARAIIHQSLALHNNK